MRIADAAREDLGDDLRGMPRQEQASGRQGRINDEGQVRTDLPLAFAAAENGLFTLLPDFGESRFHFMLFLLTGFGRRSLALFNQTIDVTLEILLARFAGGVFVLFHGFGNFMVSTAAANSAPVCPTIHSGKQKNGQLRRIVRFGSGRRTRIPDIQYCISNNYKPIHLEIYSNKVYLLIYSNILISIIHIYFLT